MSVSGNIKKHTRVILAGLQLPSDSDLEHASSMSELERLVKTLGFETIGRVSQKSKYPAAGTIFGKGKLKELASWTGGPGFVQGFKKSSTMADDDEMQVDDEINLYPHQENPDFRPATMVVLDCELTPTQLSNLEDATGVEVLDRSGVILEIFSRHAKSRESRLQVEIAKLAYAAPRLRVSHLGGDRQGGGIGSKGAGETRAQLDKRRIRDRIAELRKQLKSIHAEQKTRRSKRSDIPLVALIGYTNAGKSSLMRQLTQTNTEGEDKLFATLDTTVRTLQPETNPHILVSDTVGFIKKLPHDLVASFRSTLDEAYFASLLLFIVDGSDANFRSQLDVTKEVIREIGADENPSRLIINKVDLVNELDIKRIQKEFPDAVLISSIEKSDVKKVREIILGFFEEDMEDFEVLVPFTNGKMVGQVRARARIIKESYDELGTLLSVRAPKAVRNWIETQL